MGDFSRYLAQSIIARVFSTVWLNSYHTNLIDIQPNHTLSLITGALTYWLPLLSNIYPSATRRSHGLRREFCKIKEHMKLPIYEDTPSLQRNRLCSRNPPLGQAEWFGSSKIEARNIWNPNCQLIENSEDREWLRRYSCDIASSELDSKHWVPLNRVRTGHGRSTDSFYKWPQSVRFVIVGLRTRQSSMLGKNAPLAYLSGELNRLHESGCYSSYMD